MHSSEEAWVLDNDCHGRVDDHTTHDPHAAGAILGYEPTELCPLQRIFYESYSMTEILLCFALLLPRARPGSASILCQLLTGKVGLTLLFGPQL